MIVFVTGIACSSGGQPDGENLGTAAAAVLTGSWPCYGSTLTATTSGAAVTVSEPYFHPASFGVTEVDYLGYPPSSIRIVSSGSVADLNHLQAKATLSSRFYTDTYIYNVPIGSPPTALGRAPGPVSGRTYSYIALTALTDGASISGPATLTAVFSPTDAGNACITVTCGHFHQFPRLTSTSSPAGSQCSDGNPCNGIELCDGAGACAPGVNLASGTSCSDGNFCNGEETCSGAGACQSGPAPPASAFDDHDACTTDSCVASRGGIVNDLIPGCIGDPGATPLDSTTAGALGDSTAFLYSGANPSQTGVNVGTIDTARAAVVRGRVLSTDGTTPAVGIPVSIVGHPEFGQTLTRTGGWYDLAVNGGAIYNVDIKPTGNLRVQRQAVTKSLNYFIVDDVVLTAPYLSVDKFAPGTASGQVVRGATTPVGQDSDGSRAALLYFPPGTRTTNYNVADGTPLDVQVTEFTVANGPQRMPGTLPGTSGYTYAVEVGIPSAAASGIDDVHFDQDVMLYVTNFTGYPVGQTVPLGYYDRTKAAWLADKSGRIIKVITAPAGGEATVDITGGGVTATAALDAFGLVAAERLMLAAQYPAGTTLWRSAVPHFSSWDANWAYGPPIPAPPPPPLDPQPDTPDDPCERPGSIIGCESRTLGEVLPIAGTPFSLHYQSERAQGFRSRFRINITDGTVLPPTLLRAHIQIEAAGRRYHYTREAPVAPNDSLTWTWDGTDAYGRVIQQGTVDARISVGFEYVASPTYSASMFAEAAANGTQLSGNRSARTVTLWKESHQQLRRSDAKGLGFGGWTLSANHVLDHSDTVYFGNGRSRKVPNLGYNYIVDTAAGLGTSPNYNDNGPALQAYLGTVHGIAAGPDGTIYVAQDGYSPVGRIRRISPDGTITTIAGLPPIVARSAGSDGAAALNAQVNPTSIAVAPDGSIVFAELSNNQVWKIDGGASPALRLVAGTGAAGDCATGCGDGGPAKTAFVYQPTSIAADRDGTIFLVDQGHGRVRRIGPEGTITTYFRGRE